MHHSADFTPIKQFMQLAIDQALLSIDSGGGPFGAIVARGNRVVGSGHNRVVIDIDPTAHAEMVAIRAACIELRTHILSDCVLYTSCEPCPMCLSAIYWARIPLVCFAANHHDAAAANFDDSLIYQELALPMAERQVKMIPCMRAEAQRIFSRWLDKNDRVPY